MANAGYKQSPEHIANIKKARDKILRAKKKLGLQWKDPLPDGHPLKAKGYDPVKAKKARKANAKREEALGVAQGRVTKDTPDAKLTPAQLRKREENAAYRARKRAENGLAPSSKPRRGSAEAGTLARDNPERKLQWQRNSRARKAAKLAAAGNGHDPSNGAAHSPLEAVVAAAAEGGTSFPLDLIPERKPKAYKPKGNGHVPHQQHVMPSERMAKLQLAAALIMAVQKILD